LRNDENNPYDPPRSDISGPGAADQPEPFDELTIAHTWQRFVTMLVDTTCIYIISIFVFFVIGIIIVVAGGDEADVNEVADSSMLANLGLGVLLNFLYYVPQEAIWGRTIGKLVVRTKIVNEDGSRLTAARAFGRTAARLIPFEAFSFLGGGGQPVGIHDGISHSRVVDLRRSSSISTRS